MDSNKDEAMKWMAIGKAAMEDGDLARAAEFLTTAQRLHPNPQVDEYLSVLYERNAKRAEESKPMHGDSVDPKSRDDPHEKEGNRHRNALNYSGSSAASATPSGDGGSQASPEQIEIVTRINNTKNYYQILSVRKDCSQEDVRKAYRKISLKVHPDKNNAAGAEEAFKAVSKAFMTLSDADLRDQYDRFGQEEDQGLHNHIRRRKQQAQYQNMYNEDMFDADDIFNIFFDMQQQQFGNFRRAHFARPAGGMSQENFKDFRGLLQLLQPILALLLFGSYSESSTNVLVYFYLLIVGLKFIQLLRRMF